MPVVTAGPSCASQRVRAESPNFRMAGEGDYLLRVVVPDMQAYEAFYKRLIAAIPLKNVTSRLAMEKIKSTTALPVP